MKAIAAYLVYLTSVWRQFGFVVKTHSCICYVRFLPENYMTCLSFARNLWSFWPHKGKRPNHHVWMIRANSGERTDVLGLKNMEATKATGVFPCSWIRSRSDHHKQTVPQLQELIQHSSTITMFRSAQTSLDRGGKQARIWFNRNQQQVWKCLESTITPGAPWDYKVVFEIKASSMCSSLTLPHFSDLIISIKHRAQLGLSFMVIHTIAVVMLRSGSKWETTWLT